MSLMQISWKLLSKPGRHPFPSSLFLLPSSVMEIPFANRLLLTQRKTFLPWILIYICICISIPCPQCAAQHENWVNTLRWEICASDFPCCHCHIPCHAIPMPYPYLCPSHSISFRSIPAISGWQAIE